MLLYKYRDINLHTLDIILNKRLYLTRVTHINDPYEVLLKNDLEKKGIVNIFPEVGKVTKKSDEYYEKISSKIETLKFCALSSEYDNILLWSHYANSFRGVVFELEIDENLDVISEVQYLEKKEILNISKNLKVEDNDEWIKYYRQKTIEWEYEKEYRIIEEGKDYFNNMVIKRIFLGNYYLDNEIEKLILLKIMIEEITKSVPDVIVTNQKIDTSDCWYLSDSCKQEDYEGEKEKYYYQKNHQKNIIELIEKKIKEKLL